jgi:hypothetical protein
MCAYDSFNIFIYSLNPKSVLKIPLVCHDWGLFQWPFHYATENYVPERSLTKTNKISNKTTGTSKGRKNNCFELCTISSNSAGGTLFLSADTGAESAKYALALPYPLPINMIFEV